MVKNQPLKNVIVGAFILWAVVAGVNLILALTGLYTHPSLGFWTVITVEFIGLVLILRLTARAGFSYRQQLGAGALAVGVVAVLLFPAAFLQLTYVVPDYADVIVESQRSRLEAANWDEERIETQLAELHSMYTPLRQSTFTLTGTLMTCLPMVAVIAIFLRGREKQVPETASTAIA